MKDALPTRFSQLQLLPSLKEQMRSAGSNRDSLASPNAACHPIDRLAAMLHFRLMTLP